jgi:hypothetical protein
MAVVVVEWANRKQMRAVVWLDGRTGDVLHGCLFMGLEHVCLFTG